MHNCSTGPTTCNLVASPIIPSSAIRPTRLDSVIEQSLDACILEERNPLNDGGLAAVSPDPGIPECSEPTKTPKVTTLHNPEDWTSDRPLASVRVDNNHLTVDK
jgi:hypothetical protein